MSSGKLPLHKLTYTLTSTMEEVDLYEDIFLPVVLGAQKDSEEENDDDDDHPVDVSSAEILKLKEISSQLTAQNTALKKNISCLYKTAQQELERKESLIERLMKRVKWLERNSDSPISQSRKFELNNDAHQQLEHVQTEVVKNPEISQRIRRDEIRSEIRPTSEKICRPKNDEEKSDDNIDKKGGLPTTRTRRHVPNHVTKSTTRADENTPHATDRQRRKRLLTSREHNETKRHKDMMPTREGRPRGTPPAPQKLTRSRSRDIHRDYRRHETRQRYSHHQKENRDDARLERRKRKRSPSPPQSCDGGDLRKILKRKRSRLEQTPKADHTPNDISPTVEREQGSCSSTPSYGELIEDELLELEFDEPYTSSAELSCPSPSEDNEQIRTNNEVESVTSDSAESQDTKTNQNGGFDTDVVVQSAPVDENKLATDTANTAYDQRIEDENNTHCDEIESTVCKETNTDELENPKTLSDSEEEELEDGEIDDLEEITERDSAMDHETNEKHKTPQDPRKVTRQPREHNSRPTPLELSDRPNRHSPLPRRQEHRSRERLDRSSRKLTVRRERDDMRSSRHGDSDVYSRREKNKR